MRKYLSRRRLKKGILMAAPPSEPDLSRMPVQAKACRTCPFEGEEPLLLAPEELAHYKRQILGFRSQHICHGANNTTLCRGGRNMMLDRLNRLGIISEPTDQAFDAARKASTGF